MASGPEVSVVISTYNREALLAQALESVFAQTLRPFEVIVADDGSTDGTRDLLAGYGSRVQTLFLAHVGYPSPVKNAAIGAAKGEIIALLDSDDIWLPDKLQRQVALLEQNPRFGFVYGNAVFLDVEGATSAPALSAGQLRSGHILRDLVHDMFIIPSTLLVRRGILDQAGLFDENMRASECYPFALRLAYLAEAGCIADPVAHIRRHPGQASLMRGAENFAGAIMGLDRFVDTHALPYRIRFEARRTLARLHIHLARVYCGEGNWQTAGRHVASALASYPLHRPAWRWAVLSLTKRQR
jgi:glycosyltransferase involved in cell wall biosynthesis